MKGYAAASNVKMVIAYNATDANYRAYNLSQSFYGQFDVECTLLIAV